MNEAWFVIVVFVSTFVIIAAFSIAKEFLRRWYEDDWCRHEWSNWQDNGTYEQYRHCSKCNKKERRHT
jgi:hypothetical protein